jgi:hypothetical protein
MLYLSALLTGGQAPPKSHGSTSHRAAAMLSMQSVVKKDTPSVRGHKRLSDLHLPAVPSSPDAMLPVPEAVNEWACLQVEAPCVLVYISALSRAPLCGFI